MRGELSKLDALYQRHAGQECYIFGNGISLKWMDLHQFSGRPSILGNLLIFHKEASALEISYCALIESFWFWPIYPYKMDGKRLAFKNPVNAIRKEFCRSIIQNPETLFFINFSNYPVARFANALYVSRHYAPPFESKNPFRDREDSHGGTLAFQLSLAIYLGFKKAYLVGHDYTHSPARALHFYEKGMGVVEGEKDYSRDLINYAAQHIDLVTVTLDGGSKTMKSITYQDLTGKEPHYRENTDIMDMDKLNSLATWKGYRIF
jgi:hypothetical protein